MTLILSELSKLGISMVADTSITIDYLNSRHLVESRSYNGLLKLIPIKKIQAGISYWGWTQIPPDKDLGCGIPMDWWLNHFLVNNRNKYNTISELAILLENELRKVIPKISEKEFEFFKGGTGGIHLAGYEKLESDPVPIFWHIHNGNSTALPDKKIDPTIVNANNDIPLSFGKQINEGRLISIIRNGEYEPYALFFDKYLNSYLSELRKAYDLHIPIPTLDFQSEFLRNQVRFIADLFSVSGEYLPKEGVLGKKEQSISNEVSLLTIDKYEGIIKYIP